MDGLENVANKKLRCAQFNSLAKTTRLVLISSKTSSASAQAEQMANNAKQHRKDALEIPACTMESVETSDLVLIVHALMTTRVSDVNTNLTLAKTMFVKTVHHVLTTVLATHVTVHPDTPERTAKKTLSTAKITRAHLVQLASI
jgi:hypothetical protein